MRTLVFDVAGEYGQFKKPFSPMSPVSYPFPPPTAVMGMLGAIAGYEKENYHEQLGWNKVCIGVGLRAPVQTFQSAINLLQTKTGTDTFFRPLAGHNTHTQVPFEFVRSPQYRIYIAGLQKNAEQDLADNLALGKTAYTVSLGLASCIADITWIGIWEAKPLSVSEWVSASVVPLFEGISIYYEDQRRYHRLRVPAVMDSQRIVHRYQEVVVAEDAKPIRGQGGQQVFYEVGDEAIAFL